MKGVVRYIIVCAWLSASKLQSIVLRLVTVLSHLNVYCLEFVLGTGWCRVHDDDDPSLASGNIHPLLVSCFRN